ncbi:MAG TPA: Ig-like domain-containing protein [Kiritimatiellia bacterium]|nr:Ig-like domain-containing protein [Kiritimatiellia bacterium]HRU70167.1 Ig-like domain-containing protein [Kiritimatiellia bacterium]
MKTIRTLHSVRPAAPAGWLRGAALVAVLAAAGLAHAQGFAGLPASITLYSNQTVVADFSLTGWGPSNVTVTVDGPATNLLSAYLVAPPTGPLTTRSLSITGGSTGGPSGLRLIAGESPTPAHTVTSAVINVTVREQPTVTYSGTNGFHGGHIDQDSTNATLTVIPNAVATVLRGRHSNTTLFPSGDIMPSSDGTFNLIPQAGQAGSSIFTVYATDSFGGWTNSITVPLTVEPAPRLGVYPNALTLRTDETKTVSFPVTYAGPAGNLTATATDQTSPSLFSSLDIAYANGDQPDYLFQLTLAPNALRSGTHDVEIVFGELSGGHAVTGMVSVTTVPIPIIVTNSAFSVVTFDEDTAGTNFFSVAYGGNTALLKFSVTFSETNLIESSSFQSVGGVSTNCALVLRPFADAFGTATATLVVTDDTNAKTNTFTVIVNPVPDPPSISGLPAVIGITNKDPWTNAFAAVTISDPDDTSSTSEYLDVRVMEPELQLVFNHSFASVVSNLNARPSDQTTWIRSVDLKAVDDIFGVVGHTNEITVTVVATDRSAHLAVTNTMRVRLEFKNTPPEFIVNTVPGQDTLYELETKTPFTLESITDVDVTQDEFTLSLILAPGYETYGTLSKSIGMPLPPAGGVIGTGNRVDLDNLLRNVQFNASEGILTNSQGLVYFIFMLSDGFDTTVRTNSITLNQLRRPPAIYLGNGAPKNIYITSADPSATPYALTQVTDPDEAGNQPVNASLVVSPDIGDIDLNTKTAINALQHPATLSALLNAARFTLRPDAMEGIAVGQSVSVQLILTVTDETGLSAINSEVTIHIERVNAAPNLGVPEEQPVLFSPGTVIRPFAGVTLSSDDTNAVTFTFSIDDPAKGTFGNIDLSDSGFSAQGAAGYTITTPDIGHILSLVTNITFTPSLSYPFPPDDPYGTVFTLTARDYQLLTATRTLAIQVQDPPRNWLVTKLENDGTPGTFQHALEHFANNDVITFALPSYPATIRMPANAPVMETGRALTIKGPGADLLTISGDSDGDGAPDRQILVIGSPVTIEGITFSHATAPLGGAFSVTENGRLTLRGVVVQDSVATQYGGAIDVFYGQLFVEGCAFLRNTVTGDGYAGGAISTFTDFDVGITNTLFDSNAQLSLNGAGGAIFAEFPDDSPDNYALVSIAYSTFANNVDASLFFTASSVYAGAGTHVRLFNTILADDPETRTLNLDSGAEFWSLGGNICDDSTYVPTQQQGYPSVHLLDPDFDLLSTDARLAPLDAASASVPFRAPLADSPALGFSRPTSATVLDQRGLFRVADANGRGASGAVDPAATAFPAVTEIQLSAAAGDTDQFIEIFAPRDGQTVNLNGFRLLVNGVMVHEFGRGMLALTNSVYPNIISAAVVPASYLLAPGRGVVVAFPKGDLADFTDFSPQNPTPVVRASFVTNAADFANILSPQGRGSVEIVKPEVAAPVIRHTFLTVFNDPDSAEGADRLETAHNSIASAPQGRGFAFLPHSSVSPAIQGGWQGRPSVTLAGALLQSPGAVIDGTAFGQPNAAPQAVPDAVKITEDTPIVIDALANDADPDGDDCLVILPVTNGVPAWTSSLGVPLSLTDDGRVLYDPRASAILQSLRAGVELLDTFEYAVVDYGSGVITGSFPIDGTNVITSVNHRLAAGDTVLLDGTVCEVVDVPDDDTFYITNAVSASAWVTAAPRTPPDAAAKALVTVTVTGLNDAPAGVDDDLTAVPLAERDAVRILAQPSVTPPTFNEAPSNAVAGVSLQANDWDIDTGDTSTTFRVTGVLSDADVHPITAFASAANGTATAVTSPAHGLASGAQVIIVNHPLVGAVNAAHTVTVVDADTFLIPVAYTGINVPAVWIPTLSAVAATTLKGASVTFNKRANPLEDNVVYNAAVSAELQTLAEGETAEDGFWYVFIDVSGAPGIARVALAVTGVNNPPETVPDPPSANTLTNDWRFSGASLASILTNRLAILTVIAPAESTAATGRADLIAADKNIGSVSTSDLIELPGFFYTDEDTPLLLRAPDLLANDSDTDLQDILGARHFVSSAGPASLLGAAVSVDASGTNVTYNPQLSPRLQALSAGETVFDLFTVQISDGIAATASQVAVLVRGVNDAPVAGAYTLFLDENAAVTFDPRTAASDIDAHDTLTLVPAASVANPGNAEVTVTPTSVVSSAQASFRTTNTIPYTVTDGSFFVAVDDTFRVNAGASARLLDVLANDVDGSSGGGAVAVASVTPSLRGGTVAVAAQGAALLYSTPAGYAGTDIFSYTVTNRLGVARTANVRVKVVSYNHNGPLHASDDEYAVARGMSITMDVLRNDALLPGSPDGLVIDGVVGDVPAGLTLTNNTFVYTAATATNEIRFTYRVRGGEVSSTAQVHVKILDRVIGVQPDFFTAEPGVTALFAPLDNDVLFGDSLDGMTVVSVDTAGTAGTVEIGPDGTNVLYTAPADYIGIDRFTYTAVDRYGAVGSSIVQVTVGVPHATHDFCTVATNTVTDLDVLANDRVIPYPVARLTLAAVEPEADETPNGTFEIEGNKLRFTAGSAVNASATYRYTAHDAGTPARAVTGQVTVVTAQVGALYANADTFTVRVGSPSVTLDVLTNDVSYNIARQPLVVYSVQYFSQRGGTVVKSADTLIYTPPEGYIGEDSFTYTASDGVATQSAFVTVNLVPGDFIVNDDSFVVGYEWDGSVAAAREYRLPLTANDGLAPAGGAVAITAVGIGAGAPSRGGSAVVSDDAQAILYRPGEYPGFYGPSNEYVEAFSYEASDPYGNRFSARVSVRVRLRQATTDISAQDDVFVVERGSADNVLDVTSNDFVVPQSPSQTLNVIHVTTTDLFGEIAANGGTLVYTPPAGFVGVDSAVYTVSDGLGGSGTARVTIIVGALPTADDRFVVLAGSVSNRLGLTSNDAVTPAYLASYAVTQVSGQSAGGEVVVAGAGDVLYTPAPGFVGTETFEYEVSDVTGRKTKGRVTVSVLDPAASYASATAWLIYTGGASGDGSLYAAWRQANFTPEQIHASLDRGDADPDGDGRSNDMEYVFGGDPNVADTTVGQIAIHIGADGSVDITYKRRVNDPDLVFQLYGAAALTGPWEEVGDDRATVSMAPDPANGELATVTHHIAVLGTLRFFRVMVLLP